MQRPSRLHRARQPTVYPEILASDIARLVGEQKRHRLGDLHGVAHPPHGDANPGAVRDRVRVDEAGEHAVHADAVGGIAVGEELGKAAESGPQSRRNGELQQRLESGKGRDIDECPAALLQHRRNRQTSKAGDIQQAEVQPVVPVGIGEIE